MSHFDLLVIGQDLIDVGNIDKMLAPYHEFETTEVEQYIQEIDITDSILEDYQKFLNRKLVDEEFNKDHNYSTLKEYIENYEMTNIIQQQEMSCLDISNEHKFRYAIFNGDELVKVIRRTNPNRKWDWYVIGGRWSNSLKCKEGAYKAKKAFSNLVTTFTFRDTLRFEKTLERDNADIARIDYIDFDKMKECAKAERRELWKQVICDFLESEHSFIFNQLNELRYSCLQELKSLEEHWERQEDQWRKERSNSFADWASDNVKHPFCFYEFFSRVKSSTDYENIKDWIGAALPIMPFALLDESGWHGRSEMYWFGLISSEKTEKEWAETVQERIRCARSDDWFAIIDCHI